MAGQVHYPVKRKGNVSFKLCMKAVTLENIVWRNQSDQNGGFECARRPRCNLKHITLVQSCYRYLNNVIPEFRITLDS